MRHASVKISRLIFNEDFEGCSTAVARFCILCVGKVVSILKRTVYNTGAEYVYANVVALRGGYLYDYSGLRKELDVGLGFMLSDILQIDGTFIKSFDGGIRNGQKRFSMILRF